MTHPFDTDLEERIIGALLSSEDALIELNQFLKPFHFYTPELSDVYGIIEDLNAGNKPVNIVSVPAEAKKQKKEALTFLFITNLTNKVVPPSQLDDSAKRLVELYMRRELINKLPEISHRASDTRKDVFEVLNEADKVLSSIRDGNSADIDVRAAIAVNEADKKFEKAKQAKGFTGYKTGIRTLDDMIGGFENGDSVVIGARPSMGKSSTMLQIAKKNALYEKIPVCIFSLEMRRWRLVNRLICDIAQIDMNSLKFGSLTPEQIERYNLAKEDISKAPLYIDDTPGMSSADIKAKANRYKRKYGIEIFTSDYVQLRHGSSKVIREVIIEASRTNKEIAQKHDAVFIELSQIDRRSDRSDTKEPRISDLAESSALESDADLIIFPHRPWYYGMKEDDAGNTTENRIKFIVGKNREGNTGDCWAYWYGNTQSIKNEDRNATQFPNSPFSGYNYDQPLNF